MAFPSQRVFALIVAAGNGARMGGDFPKQYQPLGGKALWRYAADTLASHPGIAGVQVVIGQDHAPLFAQTCGGIPWLTPVIGGATRSDSVRAGLEALLPHQPDAVLIHDAARPFLMHTLIDALLMALVERKAAIPTLPVVDTMRRSNAGGGWAEIPRDGVCRVQTPQAFPFAALLACYRKAGEGATDDAALWLLAGHKLYTVPGDERLRKITTADDREWAMQQLGSRVAVGSGFDVHAFVAEEKDTHVMLGGVAVPHTHRLEGHSDADVVLHALVDALLGGIAAGDIGSHFPPTDERWRGADSRIFVEEAQRLVKQAGGVISHVDITVIGERPKILPHREAIRANIAALLDVPLACVSVKATTTERLGFTGRSEGLAAQAVTTLRLPEII